MKKINTSPISGTQELLPASQQLFDKLKTKIAEVYRAHGFLNIETPTIERTEILLAKAGGETEKQIYKVVKTAESADAADQALRFDHTVPLARYVSEHESDLTFPFKVAQIGANFRGERAQKGRFREFYQCDIDVIGRGTLSIAYDVDVISTLLDALSTFGLSTPLLARISNRKILTGFLSALGLTTKSADIFAIIDHSEKGPAEKTLTAFAEIGLSEAEIAKLTALMQISGPRAEAISALQQLGIDHPTFEEGVAELDQVLTLLEKSLLASSSTASVHNQVIADLKIIRGLDYYTGTVFEFNLPEYQSIGSICGGGRYDNLTSYFSDQPFPGVGGSIGLTRLFYVLTENNILKSQDKVPLDICIVPISEAEVAYALNLATKLRKAGRTVDVILTDKKLGDKLTYASKVARKGIVVGENEVQSGTLKLKDFATGEITALDL